MKPDPAAEPPIDMSLTYYMEERALAIALEKADTPAQRVRVERLVSLRAALMARRAWFGEIAVAKRHARGEIYSGARVAAINAMGPDKAEMDRNVQTLYQRQPDLEGVLKAHARSHFVHAMVSARLMLASSTPDMADDARRMQGYEDAFASAWVGAIADTAFKSQLAQLQREALAQLRTASRPMYLVTRPAHDAFDDASAQDLGRVWNKLDQLAQELGLEPLSTFIALPEEEATAGVSADQLLPTVTALMGAVQAPGRKFPSKRATITVLTRIRDILTRLNERDGRAYFEVDI